jgi:EAL domain-containing protein (putative c-di-GMP-specific phosphodiesterase class I)
VRDLVALVHLAGATVVVDGVGSDAEADRWREAGADVATGPLPANLEAPEDIC